MISLDDLINVLKTGGASVILLLLVSLFLFMTRKIRFPDEIVNERERRIEDNAYRDNIIARQSEHIEKQSAQIDRLQDNFEVALKSIKDDMLPLIDRALSELQKSGSHR